MCWTQAFGAKIAFAARRRLALLAILSALAAFGSQAADAADPRGVWMIDHKAAVRIFDCGDSLCGRIVWLDEPRDQAGEPKRDRRNPDVSLRDRMLCGLDVLSGLRNAGPDAWQGGSFYNPQDGHRYGATMQMKSDEMIVARFFVGVPMLGQSRTLRRLSAAEASQTACHDGTMTASAESMAASGQ